MRFSCAFLCSFRLLTSFSTTGSDGLSDDDDLSELDSDSDEDVEQAHLLEPLDEEEDDEPPPPLWQRHFLTKECYQGVAMQNANFFACRRSLVAQTCNSMLPG